jgi:hypothetical protein
MNTTQELTREDIETAFRRATQSYEGSRARWAERAATGLTDADLAAALKYELGIWGGSGCRDSVKVTYQGSGLKIWATWSYAHPRPAPILEGNQTVAFARAYYRIPDPADAQLSLF